MLRFLNGMEPSTQRANYEQLAAMAEEGVREWVEGTLQMVWLPLGMFGGGKL